MGLFDGTGLGGPSQPSGLGGLLGGIAGYNPGYSYSGQQAQQQAQPRHFTMPMGLGAYFGNSEDYRQQASINPECMAGFKHRKVKHVESRVLAPMEVATKQIEGAVQSVVDAQESVRG